MTEWKEYKLGEIATFSQGVQVDVNLQSYVKEDEYIRFVRIVDYTKMGEELPRYIKNPGDKYLVSEFDLVMIRYGSQTAGKVVKGICGAIANNMFKIDLNSSIADNVYVYYWLSQNSVQDYFMQSQASSTMPAITFDMIGKLEISLPPLPEQIRIASILSSLDDKIDLLHRENKTLEAMAETLFRQWFIEEAKEDWEEVSLEDIAYLSAGGDKPKNVSYNRTNELNIPIYSNGIENEGLYGYTDIPKITEESVTISARGTIGYVVLRTEPFVPIVRLITLTPKKNITSKYLYFWAKSQDINGTGTTQQQLTIPDFKLTKILLPEKEFISKFTNEVDKYYKKILLNKQQIQTLIQQRDGLLPKLMSGEVKI